MFSYIFNCSKLFQNFLQHSEKFLTVLNYVKKGITKKGLNNAERLVRIIFLNEDIYVDESGQEIRLENLVLTFKNFIDLISLVIKKHKKSTKKTFIRFKKLSRICRISNIN